MVWNPKKQNLFINHVALTGKRHKWVKEIELKCSIDLMGNDKLRYLGFISQNRHQANKNYKIVTLLIKACQSVLLMDNLHFLHASY